MPLFSQVEKKYKLLMVILLPLVLLLGCITNFLVQDYNTIQSMETVKKMAIINRDTSNLIDALQEEEKLSIQLLLSKNGININGINNNANNNGTNNKELLEARQKTDLLTENLK